MTQEHVYGPIGHLATYDSATNQTYWSINDHLGTPQALTDASGTVVWTMSQTPFGIATVNEDPDGNGINVTDNFRFPGQYYDAETGLNYNMNRTYDPMIGRYTQSDPIGLNGGMNTYAYVGGNPINGIDPYGLVEWKGAVGGVSGALGIAGGSYLLRLTSDCVNHKEVQATVLALGLGGGFSFSAIKAPPVGSGASNIKLEDDSSTVNPTTLSGFFVLYTGGVTVAGFNKSITFVNVGRARNKDFFGSGMNTDILSIGYSVIVGPSILLSHHVISCSCGN